MKIAKLIGAALLGTALMTGCMSAKPDKSDYSGWMDDYSNLSEFKTSSGAVAMRWVNPELKKGQYRALMIDPIAYYPAPPADSQVPQKTIQALPNYLTQQMRNNIGSEIKIVQKPGPGVLRLRAAITGVETPTEGPKAYEVIPVALIFAGASAATGHRDHNTLVYLEAQLIDSESGEVMAKSVRKGIGENLENDAAQMTLETAKPILNGWAKDAATFARTFIE